MAEFTVSEVIPACRSLGAGRDGDTFKVKNGWKWDKTGDTVCPTGYDTPEENERGYEEAKRRLSDLILNKQVNIKSAKTIDDYGRLVADVYYRGKNLTNYFPEYKT